MINTVLNCLNQAKIDGYEVNYTKEKSSQLFYVLDKIETSRYSDNQSIHITVYNQHDDYLGSSKFIVNSADNIDSINQKINNAYLKAALINNPIYQLTHPDKTPLQTLNCYQTNDLNELALDFGRAVYDVQHDAHVWISSTEIFANQIERHYFNSHDVHLAEKQTNVEVETIATSKNDNGDEFEVYFNQKNTLKSPQSFKKDIELLFRNALYRAQAKPLDVSKLKQCDVLIHDEMISLLTQNFTNQLSYMLHFYHMNHYKLKDRVAPYQLNMSLVPVCDNAVNSKSFDTNGVILKEVDVIQDGIANTLHGDIRFGQYLKQEQVTGITPIVKLSSSNTYDNIDNYIEVITFSSPQLISDSGYFGGEVRLALYHHDGLIEPVSGFSISGNIYQDIQHASFSKQQVTLPDYVGPDGILFKNLSIH